MFTGIIEEVGQIISIRGGSNWFTLNIKAKVVLQGLNLGDSIAVNGVCLTATNYGAGCFSADVMPETMDKTILKKLKPGSRVNLERALTLNKPLGGHIVTGHIDGIGVVTGKEPTGNAIVFRIKVPQSIKNQLVYKGSVAINGISLTVASVDNEGFTVSVIPHTIEHTTLMEAKIGDEVNIESDVLGKFVQKNGKDKEVKPKKDISLEFLREHGFA